VDGQFTLMRELDPSRDGLLFVPKNLLAGNQPGSQGFQGCIGKFHYNSIGMSLRLDGEMGTNNELAQNVGGGDEMRFRRNRFQLPHRHRRDQQGGQGIVRLEAAKGVVQGCSQVWNEFDGI
jgi:hypothetical protein